METKNQRTNNHREWVEEEFREAEFGDARLKNRLCLLAQRFSEQPEASIPKANENWGQTCGAYRFFDNRKVTMEKILEPHRQKSIQRMSKEAVVLAVQDTTLLSYTHPSSEGLGPVGVSKDKTLGFLVHSTLGLSVDGRPLGILDVQSWARSNQNRSKKHLRNGLAIEEKESNKWLKGLEGLQEIQAQNPQSRIVSIADREADIYDLFEKGLRQPQGPALLIRAQHNRRLSDDSSLVWDFVNSGEAAGQWTIKVPRKPGQKTREAKLSIYFREVEIRCPKSDSSKKALKLFAIVAREIEAPKGVEPIEWRLLTTLPIFSLEDAIEKIQWYMLRWQIEVYHRILKTGCRVEEHQLQSLERLQRVLAVEMIVAWRIFFLTKQIRQTPDVSAEEIFEENEWKALYFFVHHTSIPPPKPPTLKEITILIAKLGGFLARKHDGYPGPMCLWRGFQRFDDIVTAWTIYQETTCA